MRPGDSITFVLLRESTTCEIVRPRDSSRAGSTLTWYSRISPPWMVTVDTPGTRASGGRIVSSASVRKVPGSRFGDVTEYAMIGKTAKVNLSTRATFAPGGKVEDNCDTRDWTIWSVCSMFARQSKNKSISVAPRAVMDFTRA